MSDPAITAEDDLVGIQLVHMSTGHVVRVRERKSTDDGWWLHDEGGLCDEVIADGTWRPLMVVLAEVERLSGEVERLRAAAQRVVALGLHPICELNARNGRTVCSVCEAVTALAATLTDEGGEHG